MSSEPIFQRPGSGSFRDQLLRLLTDESVIGFRAVIAFATLDGVLMLGLEPNGALHDFLVREGSVDLIIGSDLVTTEDALRSLRTLSESFPATFELRVFSSQDRSLFHPKIYMFERSDGTAIILSGSNNLTRGGLVANTEYAVREDMTAAEYAAMRIIFDEIAATPSAVVRVTEELLQRLRNQRRAERRDLDASSAAVTKIAAEGDLDTRVLIQTVPKAGDRTSQVGIRAETMLEFFGLQTQQQRPVRLQQVQPGELPGPIELRPLVRSEVNRNSRIEVAGMKSISYPAGDQRPILIFEEVGADLFRYLLLMPGDEGYSEVSGHLLSAPTHRSALPGEITSVSALLETWPSYPT